MKISRCYSIDVIPLDEPSWQAVPGFVATEKQFFAGYCTSNEGRWGVAIPCESRVDAALVIAILEQLEITPADYHALPQATCDSIKDGVRRMLPGFKHATANLVDVAALS